MQCPVSVETIWLTIQKKYTEEHILSAISASTKPNKIQYSKISKLHNSKVGHFGLERTLRSFKKLNNVWQFQRQHVRHFIDNCPCCQKMSMLKIPIHAHGFTTSTYTPMECLNIDFFGPFPVKGYILVIVCTFTRSYTLQLMLQPYQLQSV